MSQKSQHKKLDDQCQIVTTMKEKTGTRNERRRNPGNRNGGLEISHPSQMQSSSIVYGTIPSGIGVVKNPKGTAEENGGHIELYAFSSLYIMCLYIIYRYLPLCYGGYLASLAKHIRMHPI